MGEKDTAGKLFVACPDVFAETVNSLVYKGQTVLLESELIAAPTESFYKAWERQIHGQFRDYGMYVVRGGSIWALYALENQSFVDKRMPLRQAGYDGAAYRYQYKPQKGQGIYPVIAIVLNWGSQPWNGAMGIRDLLDYPVPEEAEDYLNRNRMHVFDMRYLKPEVRERFQGDMRIILDYLSDRESLLKRRQTPRNAEEVMLMLYALSKDDRYIEMIPFMKETGGKDMCDLLDAMVNKGKSEGIREGVRILIVNCRDIGLSYEDTASRVKKGFCLEDTKVREEMELYW